MVPITTSEMVPTTNLYHLYMLKTTLTALSCSLIAAAAFAGTSTPPAKQSSYVEPAPQDLISYNNLFINYNYSSADFLGVDVDGHGVQAGVEYSPVNHLYLALNGGWSNLEVDFSGLGLGVSSLDFDYWTLNAGVGGYLPITNNIHFVTEVGASYANLGFNDFGVNVSTDDWGIYVMPHFRAKFGIFETHLGVTYNSNDVVPSEWTGFARLLFEVAPQLDLFVSGVVAFDDQDNGFDDAYGLQAGLRFKF